MLQAKASNLLNFRVCEVLFISKVINLSSIVVCVTDAERRASARQPKVYTSVISQSCLTAMYPATISLPPS